MDLHFLGRGAAFNPKEGNNSAYFIENDTLFLIDCGENIFEKIILNDILNSINNVNVLITHTHSDHIGSLGTLIMYCYYVLQKKLNIIIPTNPKYLDDVKTILRCFGCSDDMYKFIYESTFDNQYKSFFNIRFMKTEHCDNMNCYGIKFNTSSGIVYYSGDTRKLDNIKEFILNGQLIDKLYIDTTSLDYPNNVHLYIGKLYKEIPSSLRDKVYCMHINDDKCKELALQYDFNIVKLDNCKKKIK